MNFNSPEFLLFMATVLLLYTLVVRRAITRNVLLLVASYVFYMSWNWKYAGLIALSTVVDYVLGILLDREDKPGKRKFLLIISLVVNLGLLAVFKYYNFFVGSGNSLFALVGLDFELPTHHLLLPVGISFYTFQTLSYSIDIYRRKIRHESDPVKFALFVSFFPQLVAGPIVLASTFLPQLHKTPPFNTDQFNQGLVRIFRGLFKKVVVADLLSSLGVDQVFADPSAFSSWDLLFALYGYSFQIYCDFSGYSDVAIGASRMLGFKIPENFNRPYLSRNVREFWTRWHISLSSWLRDYLYISLGGGRSTPFKVMRNLMVTMLLGGLWHGAALNFVLWGGYHGLLLVMARNVGKPGANDPLFVKFRERFVCFHLVVVSWLLFRIENLPALVDYGRGLIDLSGGTRLSPLYYAILILAAGIHFMPQKRLDNWSVEFTRLAAPLQGAVYAWLVMLYCGLDIGAQAFIYFQF